MVEGGNVVRQRQPAGVVSFAKYGYILARMRYAIVLAPAAAQALKDLKADPRARVRDALETHLRYQPTKVSKSRIQRLRGLSRPQFRLRVDDIRVFYDITGQAVEILAIVSKAEAEAWLAKEGVPEAGSSPGEGQR